MVHHILLVTKKHFLKITEADASELLENLQGMFPLYYIVIWLSCSNFQLHGNVLPVMRGLNKLQMSLCIWYRGNIIPLCVLGVHTCSFDILSSY